MDRLSPEVVHIIASQLSVADLLRFRLTSRSLAEIGAAHLLPLVTFEAHEQELARLGAIARHPVLARNVRSLVYFADTQEQPPVPLGPYVAAYKRERDRTRRRLTRHPTAGLGAGYLLSQARLETAHREYVAAAASQQCVLADRLDVAALRDEVLPRLAGLRALAVIESYEFGGGGGGAARRGQWRRKTPFNDMIHSDSLVLDRPFGGRQLEALLQANSEVARSENNIESLCASSVHWSFLDREDPAELRRLFDPLVRKLKRLELAMSIEVVDGRPEARNTIEQVEEVMARGHVRDVLGSLAELDTLAVDFSGYVCRDWHGPVVALGHLLAPGCRWRNLRRLALGAVHCPRQELEGALQLHRATLRELCLHDFGLELTSWRKLLPWIRQNMDLSDACLCGYLKGCSEDGVDSGATELWCLDSPLGNTHGMRSSVNMYCRRGGKCYPDKLPLSADVVLENYDEWVAAEFPRGDKFRVWTEIRSRDEV